MPVTSPLRARTGIARADQQRPTLVTTGRALATVASAALRAVAAVAAGLLLCGGLGLLLWSITPGSGSDAMGLLRGSVVALAAGHFLPVTVGGVAVTIHPLLITVIAVAVIASSAGRARPVRGRTLEALHGSVFAVVYALLVDVAVALLAPADAARAGLLAPLAVAVVGVLAGVGWHRTAWSRWWRLAAPDWLRAGVRGGICAVCVLLAAAAVALALGLAFSLPDAVAIGDLTGGSGGDAFGQLLLCLAFLPNGVIAGVGYLTGAGFTVGAAAFSPLAVHHVDLPAIPLLAAAPEGPVSSTELLAFAGPAVAIAMATIVVVRAIDTRLGRLIGALVASAVSGALVAGLAAVAGGGVAGGEWSTSGVPAVLAGGLTAGMMLIVSGAACAVAGWSRVPWRAAGDGEHDAADAQDAESETAGREDAGREDAGRADSVGPGGGHDGDGATDGHVPTDPETESDADADAVSGTETESDADTDAASGTEARHDPDADAEADADVASGTDVEADRGPDSAGPDDDVLARGGDPDPPGEEQPFPDGIDDSGRDVSEAPASTDAGRAGLADAG